MDNPVRTTRFATVADRGSWDRIVSHPLQSWAWGEFRTSVGIQIERFVEEENSTIVSCWQLSFHSVPFTPFTVGYFPKGPMPTKEMIGELVRIGKQKRAIFIQLEPNTTISGSPSRSQSASWRTPGRWPKDSFQVKPSHHPLFTKYTFVLNLTKSEDELLKSMHSKTRYNIRLGQRHGVSVQEDNSDSAFAAYLRLTAATTARQAFYAHNERYHRQMWGYMRKAGIAHLFTATYKREVLAAWILFVWNATVYYPYGASSRQHREVMAPNLMLWELIRWAKKQGAKYFDLWGALGPPPDPHDAFYGFHRFKEGYGPRLVELIGSYDLVIEPLLYNVYRMADTVRWFILKHKSPRL